MCRENAILEGRATAGMQERREWDAQRTQRTLRAPAQAGSVVLCFVPIRDRHTLWIEQAKREEGGFRSRRRGLRADVRVGG